MVIMADVQTTVRMPPELRDALHREAQASRISGNTIMIQAIRRELVARDLARRIEETRVRAEGGR